MKKKMNFFIQFYWILNYLLFFEILSLVNTSIINKNRFNSFNQPSNNSLNQYLINRKNDLIPKFSANNKSTLKRNLIKRNIFLNQNNFIDECCETVAEVYKPLGGVSRFGKLLILYRDENLVQTFYQLSCKKEALNKPCKFLDKQYESRSVCTQRYSYTLALVREPNAADDVSYRLDNIRIKNGCTCVVQDYKM